MFRIWPSRSRSQKSVKLPGRRPPSRSETLGALAIRMKFRWFSPTLRFRSGIARVQGEAGGRLGHGFQHQVSIEADPLGAGLDLGAGGP